MATSAPSILEMIDVLQFKQETLDEEGLKPDLGSEVTYAEIAARLHKLTGELDCLCDIVRALAAGHRRDVAQTVKKNLGITAYARTLAVINGADAQGLVE